MMKSSFVCSLCYDGILGGGLIVDEDSIVYKTGKTTVACKFRNLELRRDDIISLAWKRILFPGATFETRNGGEIQFPDLQ